MSALRDSLERDGATPLLLAGFDYWDAQRGDRAMPSRADIDPAAITPLLPNLILMDVLRDAKPGWPLDFRYRVLGTFADEHMLARYTGTCMSDLPHQQPGSRIWQSLEAVTTQQVPRVNRVPYVGPHKDFLSVVDIVMPLSTDGVQVDKLLCFLEFVARRRP
ncbi:PAS domain-containing protein [Ferrovibrio xuzhouensis]|uniref:PAS domain-containing protein n=1 Tax=Ferrovibrio xuzhouensis TaxID=1576914 RepID=A0ABV7VBR7_9PROT